MGGADRGRDFFLGIKKPGREEDVEEDPATEHGVGSDPLGPLTGPCCTLVDKHGDGGNAAFRRGANDQ